MGSFDSLKYRDYRLLWLGSVVSNVGTWMQAIALSWYVFELTRSPFWVSMVTFVNFLPMVLSPIAGALTDRFDRRRILLGAQVFMMLDASILAVLAWTDAATLGAIMALTFGMGLGFALNGPGWHAFIPSLVPSGAVVNAIALNTVSWNLARVVGPAIAGGLLVTAGAAPVLGINALSFLAVVAALLAIRTPSEPGHPGRSVRDLVVGGLAYTWRHPRIRAMIVLIAVLSFFGAPALALQPIFAAEVFGKGAEGYGVLAAALGAGALAGGLLLARFRRVTPLMVALSMVATAVSLAAFASVRSFPTGVVLMGLHGAAFLFVVAGSNGQIQLEVEDRLRGRVVSIWMMAFGLTFPLGSLVAGAVADAWGAQATTFAGAVVCALWGLRLLWTFRGPSTRPVLEPESP